MCLKRDPKLTKTKVFGKNRRRIVCWKVIHSLYRGGPYYTYPRYIKGEVCCSNRLSLQLTTYEADSQIIGPGLHVFLHLEDAQKFARERRENIVVKVICHRDDFVAAGVWGQDLKTQQAVFMKVFVPLDCDDLDPKEIALSCV